MLKQFVLFLSIAILLCAVSVAQEKPQKEQEVTDQTEKIITTESSEDVEKLPTEMAWNKVCPVRGNPVEDDTPTVEYEGKTYGFCCPGCDVKFANNPEKYLENLSEDGTRYIGR